MKLIAELKRRSVFRVALLYVFAAWLIIQVGETVFPVFDIPDAFLRGLILLLVLAFVPVLMFAWAFEWTPDGIRRETDVDVPERVKRQMAHRLNQATLIAAVLAIGLLIADRMLPEPATPANASSTDTRGETAPDVDDVDMGARATVDPASIAVLPFSDLSPDGDQEYFSDGISEEILNVLADIDGLRVASRTSSFVFKGERKSIPLIAEELEVAHVLEGSVRKAGNRIRITAQLIGAGSDAHLWSETYDRELSTENLFAIQDDIANAIVDALGEAMNLDRNADIRVAATTDNLDAYDLYLQARQSLSVLSLESARLRVELLQRAVELDPKFADAWGELAFSLAVLPSWDHSLAVAPYQHQGLEAAAHGLALDPDNEDAWDAILTAYFHLQQWDDFARQLEAARRQIADFDASPEIWLGLGYLQRARSATVREQDEDPELRHFWVLIEGLALEAMGEDEQALERLEAAVLAGYQGSAESNIADIYRRLGESPAANAVLSQDLARRDPDLIPLLPYLHDLMAGDLAPGSADVQRFIALARELGLDAHELARPGTTYGLRVPREIATALGHADAVARTYFAEREGTGPGGNSPKFWMWTPKLKQFRQSEAFRQRVRDTGMLAYWREHGWPDKCRPVGADDFECE